MNYKVLTYGSEVLREKAKPVEKVTDDIRQLAKDMISTMYASNGVGLAAEQIGRTESVCVLDVTPAYGDGAEGEGKPCPAPMPLVLINPEITETEGECVAEEGCLSFPDIFVPVKRPERIVVKYMSIEGEDASIDTDGFLARAIQHEMDHLNGVLLYDHMSAVKRVALAGKLRRLKKQD